MKAFIYAGKHYGAPHEVILATERLVTIMNSDQHVFTVPRCDVEFVEPDFGVETYRMVNDAPAGWIWWCDAHNREATHMQNSNCRRCCDPQLAGILAPCRVALKQIHVTTPAPKEHHAKS